MVRLRLGELAFWRLKIEPGKSNTKPVGHGENEDGVRHLGDGIHVHIPGRRPRSISENLLTFAVIPALLLWSLIFLLVGGDFKGAVQFACALMAGGFVGWSLCESK